MRPSRSFVKPQEREAPSRPPLYTGDGVPAVGRPVVVVRRGSVCRLPEDVEKMPIAPEVKALVGVLSFIYI